MVNWPIKDWTCQGVCQPLFGKLKSKSLFDQLSPTHLTMLILPFLFSTCLGAWKQIVNEIVNETSTPTAEVTSVCWSITETEDTLDVVFHSACSFPSLVLVSPNATTINVSFQDGAQLSHFSLCDVTGSADFFIDTHNAPNDIHIEFPARLSLPFSQADFRERDCTSIRNGGTTEIVANDRLVHFNFGLASNEVLSLIFASDFQPGHLFLRIDPSTEFSTHLLFETSDLKEETVVWVSVVHFPIASLHWNNNAITDFYTVLVIPQAVETTPEAMAFYAVRLVGFPSDTTQSRCLLYNTTQPQTWNDPQCQEKSSEMEFYPRGAIDLDAETSSWISIHIQHPTILRTEDELVETTFLNLITPISGGVAVVQSQISTTAIVIDRNQPNCLFEGLEFQAVHFKEPHTIDTNKVLFYAVFSDESVFPNENIVKQFCGTRFYHPDFQGIDDCSCFYNGSFDHADCDFLTDYITDSMNVTVYTDIHRESAHFYHDVTVKNDLVFDVPCTVVHFHCEDVAVTITSKIETTALLISQSTQLHLMGGSLECEEFNITASDDVVSSPLFLVSGSSALAFRATNLLPDTCLRFAALELGSQLELRFPATYTVALLKDTVYLSNGDVSTCDFEELTECFDDPTACEGFLDPSFSADESEQTFFTFGVDWSGATTFSAQTKHSLFLSGNAVFLTDVWMEVGEESGDESDDEMEEDTEKEMKRQTEDETEEDTEEDTEDVSDENTLELNTEGDLRLGEVYTDTLTVTTSYCQSEWMLFEGDITLNTDCPISVYHGGGTLNFGGSQVRLGLTSHSPVTLEHLWEVTLASVFDLDEIEGQYPIQFISVHVDEADGMVLVGSRMTITKDGTLEIGNGGSACLDWLMRLTNSCESHRRWNFLCHV